MELAPGQVMELLDITQETLRTWKAALPPIQRRKGYRPCYNLGDVLALAVVRVLVKDMGCRIGSLTPIADGLFRECRAVNWVRVEKPYLSIEIATAQVHTLAAVNDCNTASPFVLIPLVDIVEDMRRRLLESADEVDQQAGRTLPLMSVIRRTN